MNTLGDACRQQFANGRDPKSTDWSMISVEPVQSVGKRSEFLGVAIMDGRWRIDIHNGQSVVFRVEAGEHTVSVHIKRRFRVGGYRGRATASLPVVVQPGEHLDLVFGALTERMPLQRVEIRWFMLLCLASVGLAAGIGWLAFPVLRDAVAWTTRALGVRQPWLSWFDFFVSSRTKTAAFTMLAWAIVVDICLGKRVPNLRRQQLSPYFLTRRPDYRKPSPVFKQQYVDPFEMSDILLIESTGGIVRLTLNRPEKRNALSLELLKRLEGAIERIAADSEARVVVLGSRGPVFCSGHDLGEMVGRSESEYRELFDLCTRVMLGLRRLPQPVIARVHGVATAAGCQLVAACDLAIAGQEATFATPGVKIGLFCTTPMVPLVRAIPAKAAIEMLLTGEPISAGRALELGLVNRVVPGAELDAAVAKLASAIVSMSPLVIRTGKRAFYQIEGLDEALAYDRAVPIMTGNALFDDAQEGISAFLEKRAARWSGI